MVVYGGARKHAKATVVAPCCRVPVCACRSRFQCSSRCQSAVWRAQNGIMKLKRLLEEEDEQQFNAEQYMQMYTCAPRILFSPSTLPCVLALFY